LNPKEFSDGNVNLGSKKSFSQKTRNSKLKSDKNMPGCQTTSAFPAEFRNAENRASHAHSRNVVQPGHGRLVQSISLVHYGGRRSNSIILDFRNECRRDGPNYLPDSIRLYPE
jgi:hypothetical protein